MNAGGVPNTCKSNEALSIEDSSEIERSPSGGWVSNAWRTCPLLGDNNWKRLTIPHELLEPHGLRRKDLSVKDGSASD